MKIKHAILSFVVLGTLAGCASQPETESYQKLCQANPQAQWLPEVKECEFMDKPSCEAAGGTFNECASPCRHDAEAEMCILSCVPVCSFK